MSSITADIEVRSYFAQLERLLDDLPEEDCRELLEDLELHLAEVAAEDDGTLVERLGPPEAYADELRAAAGLPARSEVPHEGLVRRARVRVGRSAIGRSLAAIAALPFVRSTLDFIPELRPGWWVLRGYLVAVGVDAVFFRANPSSGLPWPSIGGSMMFGLFFIGLCVWVSVLIGRASRHDERLRRGSGVANAAIVLLMLIAMPRWEIPSAQAVAFEKPTMAGSGYLSHGDGSAISNICAYESKHKGLKHVLLYDQDGRPLEETAPSALEAPLERQLRVEGYANEYPRRQQVVDPRTGEVQEFACPKLVEPPPGKAPFTGVPQKPVPMPGELQIP